MKELTRKAFFGLSLLGFAAGAAPCDKPELHALWGKWKSDRVDYQVTCPANTNQMTVVLKIRIELRDPPVAGQVRWDTIYNHKLTLVENAPNVFLKGNNCSLLPLYDAGSWGPDEDSLDYVWMKNNQCNPINKTFSQKPDTNDPTKSAAKFRDPNPGEFISNRFIDETMTKVP